MVHQVGRASSRNEEGRGKNLTRQRDGKGFPPRVSKREGALGGMLGLENLESHGVEEREALEL